MSKVTKKTTAAAAAAAAKEAVMVKEIGDENKNPMKVDVEEDAGAAAKKRRGRPAAKKEGAEEMPAVANIQPLMKPTENLVKNVETEKKAAPKSKEIVAEPVGEESGATKNKRGKKAPKVTEDKESAVEVLPTAPVAAASQPVENAEDISAKKKRGRKPSGAKSVSEIETSSKEPESTKSAPAEPQKSASLTITGQTFYSKEQKQVAKPVEEEKKPEPEPVAAKASKKPAPKKEKEPAETKPEEDAGAKKKPKVRVVGKSAKEPENEEEAPKVTPPKASPPKKEETIEAKTSQEVEPEDGKKKRGRKPAAK